MLRHVSHTSATITILQLCSPIAAYHVLHITVRTLQTSLDSGWHKAHRFNFGQKITGHLESDSFSPGQLLRPVSRTGTCQRHTVPLLGVSIPQKESKKKIDIYETTRYTIGNRISDEPCFQGRVRGVCHNSRPAVIAFAQSARAYGC